MTERHPKESFIGHAGRLVYQPFGVSQAEDCDWQSARNVVQKGPCFRDLGAFQKWHSENAAPQSPDEASGSLWLKCTREKTWLLKSHPGARLGNEVVQDLLSEAHSPQELENDAPLYPPLFAVGELADTRNIRGGSSAPFLALAVGGANHILRLARLDQEEWRWKNDETVGLHLLDISDHQPATWKGDVGSIRRIKSVVDSRRYEPTRWLLVQWESETRVFQPEFRKIPIGILLPGGEEASHIAPNPLFSISRSETGGSPHTDAAFNPGTRSKPAQLGLIDEKGYWSIWNVAGVRAKTSKRPRTSLYKCGHIQDGILKRLPYQAVGLSGRHTISWVGGSDDPLHGLEELDIEDTALSSSPSAFPPLERASTLLLGNSKLLRLFDLNTNVFLPDISFVPRLGLGYILDVQLYPQDPRYFFVLTTTRLFVVGIFSAPGAKWDQPTKHWSILLSTPHHRDGSGPKLQLSLAPGANTEGQATILATMYSSANTWLDIFQIHLRKQDPESVTFYHEAINLEIPQDPSQNPPPQAIWLHPVAVTRQPSETIGETARLYVQQKVRFYQLVTLDTRLNVISKLCVSSTNPVDKIVAPDYRVERPVNQKRQRKLLLRYLGSRFVVPVDVPVLENRLNPDKRYRRHVTPVPQRFLKLLYEQFSDVFEGKSGSQRLSPNNSFGSHPFDAIQYAVQKGIDTGSMPATTLLQIVHQFDLPEAISHIADEWDIEVERLQHVDPNLLLLDLGLSSSRVPEQSGSSLGDVHVKLLELATSVSHSSSNSTWATERRLAVLRKIACDLYLSMCGLIYGKPNLAETHPPEAAISSQLDYPDDLLAVSSPASQSRSSPGTDSQATADERSQEEYEEEPAMALLRAYTGSGKFVPKKRFELLGQWRVGSDPNNYVFDLDKEKEVTPGMQRKARILARESRKRRRAETLLQIKQEPNLPPSTQPAPEARFSQRTQPVAAFSSQSQIRSDPITMSQPVAGPFAQRPKKRPKRKGGF